VAGTLAATNGGTGQSSFAVGDLLFASTTTALSKLADVATGNALISGGVGVAPSYGKIGLTTHVSGTLPVANGGTGITTTPSVGTIPYGTGSVYSLLAAGTAGQGFAGADGAIGVFGSGGGGGGSSAAGSVGSTTNTIGGAGGTGTSNSISGSAVTYATGGTGGRSGGAGGNATANTGNGAPGRNIPANSYDSTGHVGGSGIVVLRYLTADAAGLTITGGTKTTADAYTVHTFTSLGSLVIA
jgi:hypothetical protein